MEKIKTDFAYLISFESIDIIGGIKQYHLSNKCYPILGIQYKDCIVDIKTKKIYPILLQDTNGNICNDIEPNEDYACLNQEFLKMIGRFPLAEIEQEDQEFLYDLVEETYQYIKQLEMREEKIVPYQKFLKKRFNYKKK